MKRIRALLLLALVLLAILAAAFLPLEEIVTELKEWAADRPAEAMLGTFALITAGFLLSLPASLMMMLGGFLFGLAKGLAVVWLAGLAASTLAFWVARTAARGWVERRIRRKAMFTAIDRAIRKKGFTVVFLTRIVMVLPFPALNYTLGLTGVRFRDYLAGSNTGMLPPYFLFVYLGTTVSSVTAIFSGTVTLERDEMIIGVLALGAVLLAVAIVARSAARMLRAELARATDSA